MGPADTDLGQITVYLKQLSEGDSTAESLLADAVYAQLQRIARRVVHSGSSSVSIEATALVNEVLLELVRTRSINWKDREHFFRTAGRLLRRRFVDHIRAQRAAKRPPKSASVQYEDVLLPVEDRFEEIILVNEGLEQLAGLDPALAELVEMVYFAGIPIASIAEIRGVSEKTIGRHLDLARRWLGVRFGPVKAPASSEHDDQS
jgi:RNA polymerase sigma factor (TIGR02999 family)